MGEGFSKIVVSQIGMGVKLKEAKVRVNPEDLLKNRESDQMVSAQKDREFISGQNSTKGFLNELESYLLVSRREFQISEIVDPELSQVPVKIRAVGFNSPRSFSDSGRPKSGTRPEGGRTIVRTSKNDGVSLLKGDSG